MSIYTPEPDPTAPLAAPSSFAPRRRPLWPDGTPMEHPQPLPDAFCAALAPYVAAFGDVLDVSPVLKVAELLLAALAGRVETLERQVAALREDVDRLTPS